MGNFEAPPVDKEIAARMFSDAKLNRMKEYEERKVERQRNLLTLKRTALPALEAEFSGAQDAKCNRCTIERVHYGISYEWHLEPVNVLKMKTNKGFYGLNEFDKTRRMLSSAMKSLVVHPAQMKRLKHLQSNKPEMPIIYVLKSKDYALDVIVLNFVLESFDIKLPISLDGMNVIAVHELLESHESLILSIDDESQLRTLLNACEYGKAKEVHLLPISISAEIQSAQSFRSSLWSFFSSHNYGIVKVSFHEPYTVADLLQHVASETTNEMKKAIKGHLLHDIVMKRPVMATNVIAFLLLVYFRDGGSLAEFTEKIEEIRLSNPAVDFAFEGDARDVAIYALRILDRKISINEHLVIRPHEDSSTLIELWDYAETLICNYALQSALVISAECLKRPNGCAVDYNEMINWAESLCEYFALEIPFYKACSDLSSELSQAFDVLSRKELMTKPFKDYTPDEMRARRIAEEFSDTDDDYDSCGKTETFAPACEVTINSDKRDEINALKNVLMPIQETYMNVIYCLKRLIGPNTLTEQTFLEVTMDAMKNECLSGQCKYWESYSLKWTQNCLRLCEEWGIVEKMYGTQTCYCLTTEYNNENEIHGIAKRIEQFSDF